MSNLAVSRAAKVGDRLMTTDPAKPGASGFAALGKPDIAVRLVPDTELAFEKYIQYYRRFSLLRFSRGHRTAKFRQFNVGNPHRECAALEFPDGRLVMISELAPGQTATVVQVPLAAQPKPPP